MPGLTDLEENINRLQAATDAAREATREAHEATADLRRAEKAIRDLLDEKHLAEAVDTAMAAAIRDGLESLSAKFKEAADGTYDRVMKQVDRSVNLCLGRADKNGKDLRPALAKALRQVVGEELGR